MEKFKHFLWFQFPAITWVIAIFIQSSLSNIEVPNLGFDLSDKVFHAIEYAIFGFLLIRALLFQSNPVIAKHATWLTGLIGTGYAISDEIHQLFVPGRTADIGDVLADIFGILLIVVSYLIVRELNPVAKATNRRRH